MIGAQKISWLYVFYGIISSFLVAAASKRMKLFNKTSEFLYFSLGFYRHFGAIFFSNFFSSLLLIFKMAFAKNSVNPLIFNLKFNEEQKQNSEVLIASINMTSGLFVIGSNESELTIHAIDEIYFKQLNFAKLCKNLAHINDDNLV